MAMGNWSADRSAAMLEELLGAPCPVHGDMHAADDCPRTAPVTATGRLATEKALGFILAGNATFTLVSSKTGKRFTFKVQEADGPDYLQKKALGADSVHFVKVLNGPDNEADYGFLGTIFAGRLYRHGRKSRIAESAPSATAFTWTFAHLLAGDLAGVEIYHEGRCGRCGRKLTVPESVTSGYGPECAGKLGVA
jgi:hypothetical protein